MGVELGDTAEPACVYVCVFVFFQIHPDTLYIICLSPDNFQVGSWEFSVNENLRRPF